MVVSKKDIDQLKALISTSLNTSYINEMRQVIDLLAARKIETKREAIKTILLLGRKNKRSNIKGLQRLATKKEALPATGKLVRFNQKRSEKQNYFIQGRFDLQETFKRERKGTTKFYNKIYSDPKTQTEVIRATSRAEAIKIYEQRLKEQFDSDFGDSYEEYRARKVANVSIDSVSLVSSYTSVNENNSVMKRASPVNYEFIPADDKYLTHQGICVIEQIDQIYGTILKKLSRENFIKKIKAIEADDWKVEDGVRPSTLNYILKTHNIGYYCFDIINKCFDKFVVEANKRNYPPLVYYCANNHMYWVGNKDKALSLIRGAREMDFKINSEMIQQYDDASNIFLKDDQSIKDIHENIPISELLQYKESIIYYNKPEILKDEEGVEEERMKTDLTDELREIIKVYNYIPLKIKHDKQNIVRIVFNYQEANIILLIDQSYVQLKDATYKDVINLCKSHEIEFKNQTFGTLVHEIRNKFFETTERRVKFSKAKREELYNKFDKKCNACQKELKLKQTQIDHIHPLACGGTNADDNLQVLCKECHFEKTREEQEYHQYVKVSETKSSYNDQVLDVINSSFYTTRSFVETLNNSKAKKQQQIFKIDMVRSRKNSVYFNKHDFPVFTVMDQVEPFESSMPIKAGLYFVESENYFPLRGNGWYSHATIDYTLNKNIITKENIKYVVYASLTAPKDYFNSFIDYIYEMKDGYEKLKVNCMIGSLKPAVRENYKTLAIGTDPNNIYYHYMKNKASSISNFTIDNETYYHLLEKYETKSEETETPIYNMILELEIINLCELVSEVQKHGGKVLDVNTDNCSCVFPNNKFPFSLNEEYLEGYYHDEEKQLPKYRLEDNSDRLKKQLLPKWKRTQQYEYKPMTWNIEYDNLSNDFQPVVQQILASKNSINIEGRAGVGKSHFINALKFELDKQGIKYAAVAPTNKAARVIDGGTIHRFIASFKLESFLKNKYKYIFIDEISMVQEIFYKFFIYLQRANPKIKFIIAGDFNQLLPIGDRLKHCDYQYSRALNQLCQGNKYILTKCRRSDDTLFNMLLPENINKINKHTFGNNFTDRHLSFTNAKRKQINDIMMKKIVKQKKKKALQLQKLPYDKNSQDVYLLKDMPVIARVNCKGLDIFNNELFTIKSIDDENIIVVSEEDKEIEIPNDIFQKLFYIAYCITVAKSQGSTFKNSYTIHEYERYDKRLKYVALSRASDIQNINIV